MKLIDRIKRFVKGEVEELDPSLAEQARRDPASVNRETRRQLGWRGRVAPPVLSSTPRYARRHGGAWSGNVKFRRVRKQRARILRSLAKFELGPR